MHAPHRLDGRVLRAANDVREVDVCTDVAQKGVCGAAWQRAKRASATRENLGQKV